MSRSYALLRNNALSGGGSKTNWTVVRRTVIVREHKDAEESPSDPGSDECDETAAFQKADALKKASIHFDYWTILKAMKFLKFGDQRACSSALSCMMTFDLHSPYNMYAITAQNGLDTLVNLSETNDETCRLGALRIIEDLCKDKDVTTQVVNLGICPLLVRRLSECSLEVVEAAAAIISRVGFLRKASTSLRQHGAIEVLVTHLSVTKVTMLLEESYLTEEEKADLRVSVKIAHALWSLSHFTKNKVQMLKTGMVEKMSPIILSGKKMMTIPMIGVLCECTTECMFQKAVETEGIVGVLVNDVLSDDVELQRLCSLALSRAAGSNPIVREMIRFHKGPKIIMKLITGADKSNIGLLTAAISALWKSAKSEENVKEFENLDAVTTLIEFMEETHEEVLVVTAGAIAEMAKSETAREVFIKKGAMTEIISLLGHINEDLLVNAAQAVGVCSDCDEGIAMLDKSDGLRLLWSLLKNSSRKVKVQALWSVKPCVMRHPDSGELIRSLMGSLSLLVQMLLQDDLEVLTAVCAVISEVALDLENLAVMTEQGVVDRLSSLITREKRDSSAAESRSLKNRGKIRYEEDELRIELHRELASAVANCSSLMENRRAFGRAGVIPVVVDYLKTTNPLLLAQACRAMNTLSQDHLNCVSIQSCGAVPYLLTAVESECQVTQIGAAGALRNIRSMLLEADERKIAFGCLPRIERLKKLAEIDAIVRVLSGPRDPFEEKAALMKGIARPSLRTLAISKAKGKGKDSSITWAETQKPTKMMRKQSSVLSWRERMSLMSQATSDRSSMGRRSTQSQSILQSKAAMRRGTMRADSVASLASQGSRASDAPPPTEYATLDVELDAQGIPKVMDDDSV